MNVLVRGSHGLVCSALAPALAAAGHQVRRLVRSQAGEGDVTWNPTGGTVDDTGLQGIEAVVHLAGENLAEGRWDEEKKRRIRESRVRGTRLLAEALARVSPPPSVMVSASAIGYYGDRGSEVLRESSQPGRDFLALVCREWEAATEAAEAAGVRVAHSRFGMILSGEGGALAQMLPIFRAGLGARLDAGRQYWSWIAIADVVGALLHILAAADLVGAVNVVAPRPVTNAEFTKTLAKVLGRPAFLPAPAFGVRLLFGEMADAAMLVSQRVEPTRLLDSGYQFRYPELEGALRHLLGK